MKFLFKTRPTMKPYNCKKWFIMRDMVKPIYVEADNLDDALQHYREIMDDEYSITITKNGLRTKQPMFRDYKNGESKQIGWVITGKTMFRDDVNYCWSNQYIDCWVEIQQVIDFEDIE